MSEYASEEEHCEDLCKPGLELAVPDGFSSGEDEDGGFTEVSDGS